MASGEIESLSIGGSSPFSLSPQGERAIEWRMFEASGEKRVRLAFLVHLCVGSIRARAQAVCGHGFGLGKLKVLTCARYKCAN